MLHKTKKIFDADGKYIKDRHSRILTCTSRYSCLHILSVADILDSAESVPADPLFKTP
jgi:hypothetical protein